ncbi:precorrin-2 C(20)-methyltransferase [Thermincola ferriacetica]|uniref:Precorrin-2 C(20)-methyltransferase n=1 Tax=Thermincola ferriacetica TaxID=281456 RepID=A0A0L6W760_9FIRM|nr:precorrin-2 C(20)-methyltransferase [Thermincola ferriacetica]KNZ70914.1 precorrin-2 C(20)-methyltransferase [Thermincola ferriacetica]
MAGKLYGLGVGPGDPELLTLKAWRVLQSVDVLCVPKSRAEKESLALSIVKKAVEKQFDILELLFPMSTDNEVLARHWDQAAVQVISELRKGRQVAFITIGDPMFYSTYAYLLERIKGSHPEIKVETIPGVTAFAACSAFINEALTEGEEKLAVIPAAYGIEELKEIVKKFENIVLMKVNRIYDEVVQLLREEKLLDKAVFVSRCGYPDQFYTTDLESLVGKDKDYMSIMIIRKAGWRRL